MHNTGPSACRGVMHALPRRVVVSAVKRGMAEMKATMEALEAERGSEADAAATSADVAGAADPSADAAPVSRP